MSTLLLLSVLAPLVLAPFAGIRWPLQSLALRLAPWAALPALALALWAPAPLDLDLPWLFLGALLELDVVGRVFLLFTALLWTVSGWYTGEYVASSEDRPRFFFFFLLTLSGNLGLVVAQDLATFYLFFALMTFAAYGLIVHEGGEEAIRAGRVYMMLAVLGEGMLLAGGLLAAEAAPSLRMSEVSAALAASPSRDLAIALLFLGFGVKAGILPLHVWLPLAHPVAPTPASAVLSGSMIKAGLLGWLRFLPVGEAAPAEWGTIVVVLGLVGAVFGVVAGVVQEDPKTILAYSSISQMGIMTAVVGAGLLHTGTARMAVGAVLVYALHHSLVKGALFLGVGVATARAATPSGRRLVRAGLAFAALAMAGAPLTSGSLAKHYVKEAAHLTPEAWAHRLDVLLPLTAVGTTLLMARFLQQTFRSSRIDVHHRLISGLWIPWLALLLAAAGAVWILPHRYPMGVEPPRLPDTATVWGSLWPVVVGGLLFGSMLLAARRTRIEWQYLQFPAGDVLVAVERAAGPLRRRAMSWEVQPPPDPIAWIAANWYGVYARREGWSTLRRIELRLTRWSTAGLLFLLLGLILLGMLYAGAR
jgi:formate hydrogenlyase subunit 3/multisubunit Na+/H+ antiporter MnhD subunit